MQPSNIELLDPSLLAELRRIELKARRNIDSDLMGRYRSAFRGTGLIFSDLREYQPGDDIRHIHWKVTARTGRPFVKTFDEERQLNVLLLVDISSSTDVAASQKIPGRTNHQKALEFAGLATTLALMNQDGIGLALFAEKVEQFIPIKRNRAQGKIILRKLMQPHTLTPKTNVANALKFVRENQRRGSVIFLVSDFIESTLGENFEDELRLVSFKHDLIAVRLLTPIEWIKNCGIVEFRDAESGEHQLLDTSSKRCIERLTTLQSESIRRVRELCKRSKVDYIEIEDNSLKPLSDLMLQRAKRH